MDFLYLVLMAIVGFFGLVIGYKRFKITGAYVFAIGSAVSSNIFHSGNYPIPIGDLVFGIDSVIYTLFIFCIVLFSIYEGKREALTLMYSSIGSICFAGFIQLIADSAGSHSIDNLTWLTFYISALGTLLAGLSIIYLYEYLKSKGINIYISVTILIILASAINSIVYFGLSALINQRLGASFGGVLAGSYIGKGMCVLFSIIAIYMLRKSEKPKDFQSIDKIID